MNFIYFVISSSTLILLVSAFRKMFSRKLSPVAVYALWLIPALRLLLPFGLVKIPEGSGALDLLTIPYEYMEAVYSGVESGDVLPGDVNSIPEAEQSVGEGDTLEAAGAAEHSKALEADAATGIIKPSEAALDLEEEAAKETANNINGGKHFLNLTGLFVSIWVCGSIILGFYFLISNRKLKSSISHMERLHEDGPLPVVVSNEVVSPCLFGLLHPHILLNYKVKEDEELYRQTIRHELSHYTQKDHIWTCFRIILCIIYWWNPLVWIGAACSKEDAELACDCRVTRNMEKGERKAYGCALIRLQEYAQKGPAFLCGSSYMAGGNGLKKRIESIARIPHTRKRVLLPVLVILGAAALIGCSMPGNVSFLKESRYYQANEQEGAPSYYWGYDYSLRNDIQSRVFYYDVYEYGELVDRHILAYGNVVNDRKGQFVLKLTPEAGEAQKEYTKLAVEFYWDGAALKESELPDIMTQDEESGISASTLIEIPLPDGIPQKLWSANDEAYGIVREKYEVEAGDDLVLAAAYLTSTAEDGQRAYVSSRLEKFSQGQLPEELKDMSMAVLIHVNFLNDGESRLEEMHFQLLSLSPLKRTGGIKMNEQFKGFEFPVADVTSDGGIGEEEKASSENPFGAGFVREGFNPAELTFVTPSWASYYQDLSKWDDERLESAAQEALQELYNLTGYQVKTAVYTSTGSGDFFFAKTAEDLEHGRDFYSRSFKNQDYEKSIPTMYLSSARRVWYSDVQQLDIPPEAERMDLGELAVWLLMHSGLYQGEKVHNTEQSFADNIMKVVMENGTFYEVGVDRTITSVSSISGPYPEGFEH